MRVAVIGAGVFGLTTAMTLTKAGHEVTVFERELEALRGSTPNSVMRLHLGLHYPRDLETAVQSRRGYWEFLEAFGEAVDLNFPNYYAVARQGSRVDASQFLEFARVARIPISREGIEYTSTIGFDSRNASIVVGANEGVINVSILRSKLKNELDHLAVFHMGCEVKNLRLSGQKWIVCAGGESEFGPFDWVVQATYGSDSISVAGPKLSRPAREYHSTLVVRARLGNQPFGMTVIDGDFLTVLPEAHGSTHLLYAPGPSVLSRATGTEVPQGFDLHEEDEIRQASERILERYREWFPQAEQPELVDTLQTIRTIESNVRDTDRRVTQVEVVAPNLISILSGKIDHCILAGKLSQQIIESAS